MWLGTSAAVATTAAKYSADVAAVSHVWSDGWWDGGVGAASAHSILPPKSGKYNLFINKYCWKYTMLIYFIQSLSL